ncbi:hypothetical protein KAI23_02810 [Candidatus Bathyarchaeota archaeon]|nr:hypothetical protein [Candidatus Bathyarchaeota archaeon]
MPRINPEIILIIILSITLAPAFTYADETPHKTASIEQIAGYNWYHWPNPETDACIIWLGGGKTTPTYVTVNPYNLESLNTMRFIEDLAEHYGMLALSKGEIQYAVDSRLVSETCRWIKEYGYKYVFVVGYSTGGMALAYELTFPGDYESGPDAGVIMSSMLDWQEMVERHKTARGIDLYTSAQNSGRVQRSVLLMYGEKAWFWGQGEKFYKNLPEEGWMNDHYFQKEWRLIPGVEHEVFTLEADGSYDSKPVAIIVNFFERVRASSLNTENLIQKILSVSNYGSSNNQQTIQVLYPSKIRSYRIFQINLTTPSIEVNPTWIAIFDLDSNSFQKMIQTNLMIKNQHSINGVSVTNQSIRNLIIALIGYKEDLQLLGISKTMEINVEHKPLLKIMTEIQGLNIKIDETAFQTDEAEKIQVHLEAGNHTIEVPKIVSISDVERLNLVSIDNKINNNSMEVYLEKDREITVRYQTQYQLSLLSEYGPISGGGWHDENSTAKITLDVNLGEPVQGGLGILEFDGWSDNLESKNLNHEVYMNEPKKIETRWTFKTTDSPILIFAFASALISIITFLVYIMTLRRDGIS